MPNVFDDDWDAVSERPGFRHRRMRLGRRLGGRMLGASVYELPPGERAFPYHLHHANEELLVVLDGEVALRTPEGERTLRTGDAALFPRGPEGAHQVVNRAAGPARVLVVSTMVEPDVMEYPDSDKIGVFAGRPPGGEGEASLERFLRGDAEVGYHEGEPTG